MSRSKRRMQLSAPSGAGFFCINARFRGRITARRYAAMINEIPLDDLHDARGPQEQETRREEPDEDNR